MYQPKVCTSLKCFAEVYRKRYQEVSGGALYTHRACTLTAKGIRRYQEVPCVPAARR